MEQGHGCVRRALSKGDHGIGQMTGQCVWGCSTWRGSGSKQTQGGHRIFKILLKSRHIFPWCSGVGVWQSEWRSHENRTCLSVSNITFNVRTHPKMRTSDYAGAHCCSVVRDFRLDISLTKKNLLLKKFFFLYLNQNLSFCIFFFTSNFSHLCFKLTIPLTILCDAINDFLIPGSNKLSVLKYATSSFQCIFNKCYCHNLHIL